MQYMVIFQPAHRLGAAGPPADFAQKEREEQLQARCLYAQGALRQVWALGTGHRGAAVLFEAKSSDHLKALIESFPLIQVAYADCQVFPLAPYPAFGKA